VADAATVRRKSLSPLKPCGQCGLLCRKAPQASNRSLCHRCKWLDTAKRRDAATARRLHLVSTGDDITWRELGERDGWICHLCSKRVPKKAGTAKNPKGATVDHLVPVSDDGLHVWENVALAHRSCNLSRGAGGDVQLRLAM